ncbi:DeoR family transcriptional regulator [Enterococcus faecium]|uniref:DeoR family transcriptional regulator n=1 Tax=Enterococcus faecium TaxID=1352 RepID=UPI0039A56068
MIEGYIEKDIMRQVKITEYLFELKQIDVQKVADLLEVSKITVKRDIEKILSIDSRLQLINDNSSMVTVSFCPEVTRYEIIKKIYARSFFLRMCVLYLNGERNYIKISEKEHISVAKVFYLKRRAEEFFKSSEIMTEDGQFIENEFKYRLVLLTIWMRIDSFNDTIDQIIYKESERLVQKFAHVFSNELNFREKYFFTLNIYLTLKRKDKCLKIPNQEFKFVYKKVLYKEVESLLSPYDFNKDEIAYIAIMYRLLNHNLSNYHYLKMEYDQIRKSHISDIPELIELIHIFEKEFNQELLKNIMFEKPFIKFIASIFLNRSMFLVEKHYFIDKRQQKVYKKVEQIVINWSKEHNYKIFLNSQSVEKFCLQTTELLISDFSTIWDVFIVAEDEFSHIAYREWIRRRLNTEHVVIDNILYYSLDSLPVYIDIDSSIIICERTLANFPFQEYRETKMFPVSLFSINKDLKQFFNYVFN